MIEVNELIKCINFSETEYDIFVGLMKRFEIDKKVFESYDKNLRSKISIDTINRKEYLKLATCFYLLTIGHEDIRFYNTALKICDLIDVDLPEIDFLSKYE